MKLSRPGRPAVLAASAALAACAVGLAAAPAAVAGAPSALAVRWRLAARTPGFLDAVVAPTARSAWALGWNGHGGRISPVARHWNGRRWTIVRMPKSVGDSGMACAGASSPRNVWAFAGAGASLGNPPASGSALRLRNGRWVLVKRFPGSYVTGCNVIGPHDVWVFGGAVAGLGPPVGTWHLTRSGWTLLKTGHLVLFGASVVSASDIWATGAVLTGSSRPTPVVARWNGHAWVQDRSINAVLPRPTAQRMVGLDQVTALSRTNVWVEAIVAGQASVTDVVVVHWDGHRWRRAGRSSVGFHLPGAVRDGHGGWWAAPFVQNTAPYLLHERGGRWTRFPLPVRGPLSLHSYALAHLPGTAAMLAAGGSDRGGVILARGRR